MKEISEKLVKFFEVKGLTQVDVAKQIGTSKAYVNAILNNRKEIGKKQAEKFENLFGLSSSWLLTGNGQMLVDGLNVIGNNNTTTQNSGSNKTTHNTTNNYRGYGVVDAKAAKEIADMGDRVTALETAKPRISYTKGRPYYNVDFIGGFDMVFNDQTINPEYYIDFAPYNKDGVMWCNITGHSMEPQISNGDIIAIKEVQDWFDYLSMGEIYAIVTTNNLRTVKIVRKGSTDDKFRFIPINTKEFDEQEVPKRMILRVFELLACIKKL